MTSGFSSYSTANLPVTILKQQIELQSIIMIITFITKSSEVVVP